MAVALSISNVAIGVVVRRSTLMEFADDDDTAPPAGETGTVVGFTDADCHVTGDIEGDWELLARVTWGESSNFSTTFSIRPFIFF